MRLTFLGTGAAGGVPLYGCLCPACERAIREPRHRRLPCSMLVQDRDDQVLIDAGLTDLHERFAPGSLVAIALTHFHADHVQGLFHMRWGRGERLPVVCPPDPVGCADLYKHPGLFEFRPVQPFVPIALGGLEFTPIPLEHSKPTFGYAIEDQRGNRFVYLTDTVGLPAGSLTFLKQWRPKALAIDCSFPTAAEPPRGHNDLSTALASIAEIRPQHAWLTHLGHDLDAWFIKAGLALPPGVYCAYDGLILEFRDEMQAPDVIVTGSETSISLRQ